MRTISVGELRQNPTAALDAVEAGETFVVTRHRREIGRLIPPVKHVPVTAATYLAIVREAPLDDDWAAQLTAERADYDENSDPWETR